MFSPNFTANLVASPQSQLLEDHHSISTDTAQFSIECESNPELNYTKFINLDESEEQQVPKPPSPSKGEFFKPIFANLQRFVSTQLSQSDYAKLIEKSKRMIKRENAKKRVKLAKMQVKEEAVAEKPVKIEKPLRVEKPSQTVEKDAKKVIQKLRNRISAQQSRDRKKVYLESLERENEILKKEISALKAKQESETLEKKIHPLGFLKLGMAFLSLFMIIMGAKGPQSLSNEVRSIEGGEEGLRILERMNLWKRMEVEEIVSSGKIDRNSMMQVLNGLKSEDIEMLDRDFGPLDWSSFEARVQVFNDFMTHKGIDLRFNELFHGSGADPNLLSQISLGSGK